MLNKEFAEIGIVADKSGQFLGVLWGGVGAAVLAWVGWSLGCCVGGRKSRGEGRKEEVYAVDEGVEGPRRRRWRF